MTNERGFAPTSYDIEFENIYVYWVECGLTPTQARWLALFQYGGGNAFGMKGLDGELHFAPRPTA